MNALLNPPLPVDASPASEATGVLFTPGPVMLEESTLAYGSEQMVYHRTREFSARIRRCEEGLKAACRADASARAVLLTASGTAAMEAAVLSLFDASDRVLVLNSGDFGRRFTEICAVHGIPTREVCVQPGRALTPDDLRRADTAGCTGFLLNHHETSTGSLHDLEMVGRFCRERGLMLGVDAIGSFLADPIDHAGWGIDALIASSQKALALPPGMSFCVLGPRAVNRARQIPCRSYYLGLARYLEDGERGQTPFTPAVGIIRQLEQRLDRVRARGVSREIADTAARAADFRERIRGLPLRLFAERPSNAVTALEPLDGRTPEDYVRRLAEEHRIFVCPNGGSLRGRLFRVGHLGSLSTEDTARLAGALAQIASGPPPAPRSNPTPP